jgi:copper(I)-binding protein
MRTLLALILLVVGVATATEPAPKVTSAWSRATPPGLAVGVLYLEIAGAPTADTLVRIETPVAARAELHSSSTEGGVMRMRPVSTLAIPASGRVRLQPGGIHGMLVDLQQPLTEGGRFPLTLVFERSGPVTVDVIVRSLGATSY